MTKEQKRNINDLWVATLLLMGISLISVYASSAMKSIDLTSSPYYFVHKQLFGVVIGIITIQVIKSIPAYYIARLTLPLILTSTLLLSLIMVPNIYSTVSGAARWINLYGLRFQPAELAKVALLFFLAKNLSRPNIKLSNLATGLAPNFYILGILTFFLMKQPDFGTAALLCLLTGLMLFVAGISRGYIFFCILGTLGVFSYAIISAPYRLQRIISYLDPWTHSSGSGFQIIQSYLAFSNGNLFGLGLGMSKQKLFFLPEAHTDFILSVIGEELGFLGVALVLGLYARMIITGFKICQAQKNQHFKFLSFGITSMIALQTIFNACVVTGLLPTKGIPLPLLSCGSSSLVTFCFSLGVLMNIAQQPMKRESCP